jgi:hypothetical protein
LSSVASDESREAFDGVHVPKRARRLFLGVSLIVLAVYLASARGTPMTFDERLVYDTTASFVHGSPYIRTPLLHRFPDWATTRSNGKQVGIYALGTSMAAAPMYVLGKVVAMAAPEHKRARVLVTATMFTNAFITAGTVFMLMLLCLLLGAPPGGSVLVGLSFGLGSYAFPHALTMFTEPGTALCLIASVFFAVRASRRGARSDLVWCGVWAGAGVLFRVTAVLFLPVLGLWLLAVAAWKVRDARARAARAFEFGAWYLAGAVGPIVLALLINWWRYGSPIKFGYAIGGPATSQSYPIARGIAGQWFSSGKSIFFYAPIAIIVVCGLFRAFRRMPVEMALLGSLVIVNTLFFARVQFWSGDWAWGPRYLQIVLPCLAAMAAPLMDSRWWRYAVAGVGVVGFVVAALPAVLVRFTIIFYYAFAAKPPPSVQGPLDWDHSYYALIWHTLHWQPILYQLRALPHAFSNSLDHVTSRYGPPPVTRFPGKPRFELWWLRARDLGTTTVFLFALLPIGAAAAGVRLVRRAPEPASPALAPADELSAALD